MAYLPHIHNVQFSAQCQQKNARIVFLSKSCGKNDTVLTGMNSPWGAGRAATGDGKPPVFAIISGKLARFPAKIRGIYNMPVSVRPRKSRPVKQQERPPCLVGIFDDGSGVIGRFLHLRRRANRHDSRCPVVMGRVHAPSRIEDPRITGAFPAKITSDSQFFPAFRRFFHSPKPPVFRWQLHKCPDLPEKQLDYVAGVRTDGTRL